MQILLLPLRPVPLAGLDQGDGSFFVNDPNFLQDQTGTYLTNETSTPISLTAMAVDEDGLACSSRSNLFPSPALLIVQLDDLPSVSAPSALDESLAVVALVWPGNAPALPTADDEVFASATTPSLSEEEAWQSLQPWTWRPAFLATTDSDELAILGLDEDSWLTAVRWASPILPVLLLDDEGWPTPPVSTPLDEALWLSLRHWPIVPLPILYADDEALPNAVNVPIDEDSYQATVAWSRSLLRQAITDTDERVPTGTPSIVEDDARPALAPLLNTWAVPQLTTDDDALTFVVPSAIEEDPWHVLRPWITRPQAGPITDLDELALLGVDEESTPTLRAWRDPGRVSPAIDLDEMAVLVIDDDGWTMAPARSILRALPPVVDDQDSLSTMVEENQWGAPTLHRLTNTPTAIWDAEVVDISAVHIRLVQIFLVRCAKTKTMTVVCAKTKPETVSGLRTITATVPV